jgi:hypothetical protein
MDKPNCYECKHKGSVPGSAHSSCRHPRTAESHDNAMANMFAIFASVGRSDPQIDTTAASALGISAKRHGIVNGWFNWPWDFDPTWLTNCAGFESKREV